MENIKSYEHVIFEFERGTTAIMGENGAGKTTLIEAVAWTLFDLLDYKKDDFLRRGAKRGLARIEFESSLDERRYIVQRDTRTAYFVYDTQLSTRIADKKEEVTRFLWQHLGVEPGTDLESLFRRAIGVPQGTFTAIFLETSTERKKAFDKLLKVEEYRIGAAKLGFTAKYVQNQLFDVEKSIARAEGELSNRESRLEELKSKSDSAAALKSSLKKIEKELKNSRAAFKKLESGKEAFEKIKSALDTATQQEKTLELLKTQLKQQLAQAEEASITAKRTEKDHAAHLKALATLKELERERVERDRLNKEFASIEKAIVSVEAEQTTINAKLAEIDKVSGKLKELEPKAKKQKELEASKKTLESEINEIRKKRALLGALSKNLDGLRERLKENNNEIKKIELLLPVAEEFPKLQKREQEITREAASIRARLERDREFQTQIQNGLCPVLSAKCLNLKEGMTLDGFLEDKFSELETNSKKLSAEQDSISASLVKARAAQNSIAGLSILNTRKDEIIADGKRMRGDFDELNTAVQDLDNLEKRLKAAKDEIESLGDPVSEVRHLQKQISEVQSLQLQSTNVESNLERLRNERGIKTEQLDTYKHVDENLKLESEKRDSTIGAHNEFIKSESLANSLEELQIKDKTAEEKLAKLGSEIAQHGRDLKSAEKKFNLDEYENVVREVQEQEIEYTRISTEAKHAADRVGQIESELKTLGKTEKKLEKDSVEKERLEKLLETVTFIRNTLKSAAPRVAKNYVFHVSVEANTLYREITGNAEATLRWTDDYGIELEEGGFDRPFIALSGGEQMSAALAVRLALLKQLSDVKLAFFDEPTTNMDHERRERLAEQISRITENQTFDQLFVISHDDTFESYADHVLSID